MEPFPEELNRKLNLSKWILKFDEHLLSQSFYDAIKEYFFESYKNNAKLRKVFHNEFLPVLDENLGAVSDKEFYKYEYFFKTKSYPKYDLANCYDYDENLNLFKKIEEDEKNELNNSKESEIKKDEPIPPKKFPGSKLRLNLSKITDEKPKDSKDSKGSKKESSRANKRINMPRGSALYLDDYENQSNNMETFGKQVDDTDEATESVDNESESNSYNKNPNERSNERRVNYFSRRFKNMKNNKN